MANENRYQQTRDFKEEAKLAEEWKRPIYTELFTVKAGEMSYALTTQVELYREIMYGSPGCWHAKIDFPRPNIMKGKLTPAGGEQIVTLDVVLNGEGISKARQKIRHAVTDYMVHQVDTSKYIPVMR